MGFVQCAGGLILALIKFNHAMPVALLGMLITLAGCFMDVVVDGMMVQQSRIDPVNGSEDLQSLSWAMYGVGGIVGAVIGGILTQSDQLPLIFFSIATVGASLSVVGCLMDKKMDESAQGVINMTLSERIKYNY